MGLFKSISKSIEQGKIEAQQTANAKAVAEESRRETAQQHDANQARHERLALEAHREGNTDRMNFHLRKLDE